MREEGWYLDPFGAHEQRWFSDGWPTGLVRDGDVESRDIPPAVSWDGPLVPAAATERSEGIDLRRAEERYGEPPPPDTRSAARRWFDRVTEVVTFLPWP